MYNIACHRVLLYDGGVEMSLLSYISRSLYRVLGSIVSEWTGIKKERRVSERGSKW